MVLRLRGRVSLGAIFIVVAIAYADRLGAIGGRLFLSGVDSELVARLQRTRAIGDDSGISVTPAMDVLGASSLDAYRAAGAWLASQ